MKRRGRMGVAVASASLAIASTLMASPTVSNADPTTTAASAGVWNTDTPSGFKRQEVTYVTVGSRMYLAGGKSTRQQAFDPVTHTWSNVAPLPVALDHIQAIALDGLVYYVGGLNGYPGTSFGAVYVYDPATNTVTTAAPLPPGRDRGAGGIVTYQGKIYVAGGFHTGASVAWFDVYDPVTNAWHSLPDMPERRDHTSAAVVAGKMYVIGGRTYGMGPRPQNDVYDFATGRWTTGLAPLPTLRAGAATVVFGDEIVMVGGEVVGVGTFNTVEAYSTTTNTWRTMTSMPTSRHGIQAAMFNGRVYIADGGTKPGGGGQTDVQEVFSIQDAGPPTVPGKPSGVSVRPGEIDLTWSASTDDSSAQITYQVFRDAGPTPVGVTTSGSSTQVTYTDTGLAPSSVHRYAVVALDAVGNASAPSAASDPITVANSPAAIFSDDFSSGNFASWTSATRLTIDPSTGSPSAPSAKAQVTAQSAFLMKMLPATYAQICVSMGVNAASFGGNSVVLLRLRTASNGPVARVFASANGTLFVKSDVSAAQLSSNVSLGVGWHQIELCGTVGSAGVWDLYRDATRVAAFTTNTGTVPVGRFEVGDTAAKTWTINFDDVVVDQVPG